MATVTPTNPTLNFEICQSADCKSFSIADTTGVWSLTNNGWGAPNWTTTDAVGANLVITLPNGTTTTVITNIYPALPDNTGTQSVTITAASLGLSGFDDGIYQFTYIVDVQNLSTDAILTSYIKTVLFTCNVKCCVDKLIARIPSGKCSCDDRHVQNALLAFSLYQALLNSGKCGNLTTTKNILETLNRLCGQHNCNCSN
jgi:hypothetical protein